MISRIAGHAIVEQLIAFGVDRVFGVPGESYLDVLDGIYEHRDELEMVVARHEGSAAIMAAFYGRMTGIPGVCLVTRGPGATNASIGVHVASQDASPMVLMIGQIPRRARGRQAFQEIDYGAMFGMLAKDVIEIDIASRAPELIARAFTAAVSGEPGPVVVVLPEDVLLEECNAPLVAKFPRPDPQPAEHELARTLDLLRSSSSPVIIADSIGWDAEASRLLRRFAEESSIPVVTAARRQDVIDNESEAYIGSLGLSTTPGLEEELAKADAWVLLAARPDGLTLAQPERHLSAKERRIVHVHPAADVIGRVFPAEVPIVSSPQAFLRAIAGKVPPSDARRAWAVRLREVSDHAAASSGRDQAAAYMRAFNERYDGATMTTVGAGNYTAWSQKYHRYSNFPTQVGSHAGAMGVGIPAAIAAAFAFPNTDVVAFAGDGCFLMNGQELSTIRQYGLDVLVIVINNSRFGTIRDHQERRYPGRPVGTALENPDFVALAQSYGADAVRVSSPAEFAVALGRMKSARGLRFVEIDITESV